MAKAKNVGKNLDAVFSTPKAAPAHSTDIEPVAPPTIVNATGLDGEIPANAIDAQDEPRSSYHKNEMLEAIFEKRNKQIAAEAGAVQPEPEKIEEAAADDAEQAPTGDEAGGSPLPASIPPEVPVETPAGEELVAASHPAQVQQKYKIMVNGQQLEYTLEELQQQAQLGVAARQKFEEAAEMRRQAEQIASSRQNSQPQQAVNNNTQPQLSDIPNAELLDIAKRMNYGSEEEQVDALRKAISLGMQQGRQGPTPEQLVNVATQNALAVLSAQQEQEILRREFPDIASDAPLAYATDLIATQLAQKYAALNQPKTRLDLLREAGNEARGRYLKPAVATPPANQPNSAVPQTPAVVANPNKIERKRAAPQTPTAASVAAKTSSDSVSSANPEAIALAMRKNAMNEIMKARGQQVI